MTHNEGTRIYTGTCLCSAVTLHVDHDRPTMGVCHCSICRKWGGGPYMSVECHRAPRIDGAEHVKVYASSEWAERGFCAVCGSHLFYRLKDREFYAVSAGLFREGGDWPFALQVFVDQKPQNYEFANATKQMTGEEVFKAFGQ